MTLAFSADTLASMPQTVFPVHGRTGSLLAMAERIGRIGSWMMTLADQQLQYSGECAAILGLAASSGATALRGSILIFFYCLGLGIPFVVAALATEWMASASKWLRRHQKAIGRVGGIMLIAIGLMEVTGLWHTFVLWLQVHFPSSTSVL